MGHASVSVSQDLLSTRCATSRAGTRTAHSFSPCTPRPSKSELMAGSPSLYVSSARTRCNDTEGGALEDTVCVAGTIASMRDRSSRRETRLNHKREMGRDDVKGSPFVGTVKAIGGSGVKGTVICKSVKKSLSQVLRSCLEHTLNGHFSATVFISPYCPSELSIIFDRLGA